MAVGIIAIGMVFIAGTFPVAIHFTTIATERTIAAVTADEAFAKIRLYGVRPADTNWPNSTVQTILYEAVSSIKSLPYEFAYPSTGTNLEGKQYFWSALCRRVNVDVVDVKEVQVTVFVSRKAGPGLVYYEPGIDGVISGWPTPPQTTIPVPVKVSVGITGATNELIINGVYEKSLINDGYTIVDDATGQIYRVLERRADSDTIIQLDRKWEGGVVNLSVWVVPPPTTGGRYPCVAVYQKIIRF